MSPIKYGSTSVTGIYRGTSTVSRVYRGTNLVYGGGYVPDPNATVYFDAQFTERGDLSAYPDLINADGGRSEILDDFTGRTRKILRLTSEAGFTHGNENPRTQIEAPDFVKSLAHGNTADVFYNAVSIYIPATFEDMTGADWLSVASGAWGPPYVGSGPNTFKIYPPNSSSGGHHRLAFGDPVEVFTTIPREQWIDLVLGFKFAYDTDGGWVSVWMNNGSGLTAVPYQGSTQTAYGSMRAGVNDGWHLNGTDVPNSPRLSVYGPMPRTVYYGYHYNASTFAEASGKYSSY